MTRREASNYNGVNKQLVVCWVKREWSGYKVIQIQYVDVGRDKGRQEVDRTYGDGGSLCNESNEVESHFSVRSKCHTNRNHENDHSEFLIRFLKAERPRYEEDSHWRESL